MSACAEYLHDSQPLSSLRRDHLCRRCYGWWLLLAVWAVSIVLLVSLHVTDGITTSWIDRLRSDILNGTASRSTEARHPAALGLGNVSWPSNSTRFNIVLLVVLNHPAVNLSVDEQLEALQDAFLPSLDQQNYQQFAVHVLYPASLDERHYERLVRTLGHEFKHVSLTTTMPKGHTHPCKPSVPHCISVTLLPNIQLSPWFVSTVMRAVRTGRCSKTTTPQMTVNITQLWMTRKDEGFEACNTLDLVSLKAWSNKCISWVRPNLNEGLNTTSPCSSLSRSPSLLPAFRIWMPTRNNTFVNWNWTPLPYNLPAGDFTALGVSKRAPEVPVLYATAATLRARWHWQLDLTDFGLREPFLGLPVSQMRFLCNPALYIAHGSGNMTVCDKESTLTDGDGSRKGKGEDCDIWKKEIYASQLRTTVKLSSYAVRRCNVSAHIPLVLSNMHEHHDGFGFLPGNTSVLWPANKTALVPIERGLEDMRVAWGDDAEVEGGLLVVYRHGKEFAMCFRHGNGSLTHLQSQLPIEKNWALLPRAFAWGGEEGYRWAIHQLHPFTLLRIHVPSGNTSFAYRLHTTPSFAYMSSSTAPIPYIWQGINGYLQVIHVRGPASRYVHRFLFVLGATATPLSVSQAFTLLAPARHGQPTVYIHSIIAATDAVGRKQLYIGYGYNDVTAWIAVVNIRELNNMAWYHVTTSIYVEPVPSVFT
jgi:hypothetical protein